MSTACGGTQAALLDRWGRLYRLRRRTVIGRDAAEVDIAVLDRAVSHVHAELLYRPEQEAWVVVDAGSTNGTYVDRQRVVGSAVLHDGQVLVFGDVGFVFVERR